jgi:hypothetical protein
MSATEGVAFEIEEELTDEMPEIIGKTKVEDWVAKCLKS